MTPEEIAWGRVEAARTLYQFYAYRVHATARRLNARHVNWQDFLSVGRFAAYRYALAAGAGFVAPVCHVVARRAMLNELRNAAGGVGSPKLAEQGRMVPLDDAPAGDPAIARFDEARDLDGLPPAVLRAVAALTPRERAVLTFRLTEGMTLDAVGNALGVCKQRARDIEMRAVQKLRNELDPPPIPAPALSPAPARPS